NFASTFIVWDRLFGTFVPETEVPTYGVTAPLYTANPVWTQLKPWSQVFRKRLMFRRPEPVFRSSLKIYLVVHFSIVVVATFGLMMWGSRLATLPMIGATVGILSSLLIWGALWDGRMWAGPAELLRPFCLASIVLAAVTRPGFSAWSYLVLGLFLCTLN